MMTKIETITLPMEIELAPHISPDDYWLVDVNHILNTVFGLEVLQYRGTCEFLLKIADIHDSDNVTLDLPLSAHTFELDLRPFELTAANAVLVHFGLRVDVSRTECSSGKRIHIPLWTLSSLKEDRLIVKPSNYEPAVELKSMVYKVYEMSCNMVEQMDLYDYRCAMQENAKPDYYITRHNGIDEIHLSNMDIGDLTLIEEFIIKLIRKKEIAKE